MTRLVALCLCVGAVFADVSVPIVDRECSATDSDCSEDSALLQIGGGGGGGKCKAIKHCCRKKKVAGFVYLGLNGEGENKVVAIDKNLDGSLGRQRSYGTGSDGGADVTKGGQLRGDYDGQGGMQIIGDYLLVVNGGGNTVTTFSMCRDGSLEHVGNVPSGGERPVSIAYYPKGGGKHGNPKGGKSGNGDEYWVVVGNQWANPLILGDQQTGNLQFFPNKTYYDERLYEKPNPNLNIFLFSFDAKTGKLTPEHVIESWTAQWGGPTMVKFNEDGTKFAVATWGIAHDLVAQQIQKLEFQQPSRLYVYDFDAESGDFSNERHLETCGDSGFVGFEWLKSHIYLTAFNAVNAKGLKVVLDDGKTLKKAQEFTADSETCWARLHPSNKYLYVANFHANTLTQFELGEDGEVTRFVANVARENQIPAGDTKEMLIDAQAKNMYVMGTGISMTLAWYSVGSGGNLALNKEFKIEELIGTEPWTSNFNGLKSFEFCPDGQWGAAGTARRRWR